MIRSLLLFAAVLLMVTGCTPRPKPAPKVVIDRSLPQLAINGTLSDTAAVAFEWQVPSDRRVTGIRLYRNTPQEPETFTRIAEIDNLLQTHYVDADLRPGTVYRYRFTVYDIEGKESMPDTTLSAATLKLPEAVTFFTATQALSQSAKLLWRPHPDLRVSGYDIQRRIEDAKAYRTIKHLEGRLNSEYIDRTLSEDTRYRYRIIATLCNGMQSAPTDALTVSTKPLPQVPASLKASQGLPRTINLEWTPVTNTQVVHYNVYRATAAEGPFQHHAKVNGIRFDDKIEANGAHYFYKITAVDNDGLESPQTAVTEGVTLEGPAAPSITKIADRGDSIVIQWRYDDERTRSFIVVKTTKSGWFDAQSTRFDNIKTTQFTDADILMGREYSYRVIAVDTNGLESAPSEPESIVPGVY